MHPVYYEWKLWVGVALMLSALWVSYMQLRSYSDDEWASLTDREQDQILWLRSSTGTIIGLILWISAALLLGM